MKSKLVLWGSNEQDEKLIVAVALKTDENKVDIWTFPEPLATEDFYRKMMEEWRDGDGLEFPQPHQHIERELTISDNLLPVEIKVERGDVVQRAQTEWHFLVLSNKLNQAYQSQLEDLKEKVESLSKYDPEIWNNLKEFWSKVQEQVSERNLLRNHANTLRENVNVLFAQMKTLRSKMDEEFRELSKQTHDKFIALLNEVEEKVNEGGQLSSAFEELKKIQKQFRDSQLNRSHRRKVWEKLDGLFKMVKEKRFGSQAVARGNSPYERTKRRYDGLVNAINKMEASIERDRNDLEFQTHKIATTGGQLEAQIRQAKVKMIEERVRSKEQKLKEMNATKEELEKRLAAQKAREERQLAMKAAKAKVKEKIRQSVQNTKEADSATGAAAKKETVPSQAGTDDEESVVDALSATLGESLTDMFDTVKAAATVIGSKIGEAFEDLKEDTAGVVEEVVEKMTEATEDVAEAMEEAKEKAAETAEEIKEELAEVKKKAAKATRATRKKVAKKAGELKEDVAEAMEEAKEKAA
ncbi:MAG TPA: hypothetical protein ENJ20_04885, partial [Bacteroidetes bacterium]|nr:hypothetical protein [Bacteroidota bacterium]